MIFLAKNKLEIGGEVLYIYIDIQNGGSAEEKAKPRHTEKSLKEESVIKSDVGGFYEKNEAASGTGPRSKPEGYPSRP